MTIAKRIRQARKAAGLNQSQLARLLEVTRASVSSWEKGGPGPHLKNLKKIARATKTSLGSLVGGAL